MGGAGSVKRCWVAYAARERQYLWPVELPEDASVQDALAVARRLAESDRESPAAAIPWDEAAVGIFGELCERGAVPRDGDRIELYRPLLRDPRQARRERARRRR